jgi:hypothetical protein
LLGRQLDQLTGMACHPSAARSHHVCFITACRCVQISNKYRVLVKFVMYSTTNTPLAGWLAACLALVLYCSQDHHAFIHLRQQQ